MKIPEEFGNPKKVIIIIGGDYRVYTETFDNHSTANKDIKAFIRRVQAEEQSIVDRQPPVNGRGLSVSGYMPVYCCDLFEAGRIEFCQVFKS